MHVRPSMTLDCPSKTSIGDEILMYSKYLYVFPLHWLHVLDVPVNGSNLEISKFDSSDTCESCLRRDKFSSEVFRGGEL